MSPEDFEWKGSELRSVMDDFRPLSGRRSSTPSSTMDETYTDYDNVSVIIQEDGSMSVMLPNGETVHDVEVIDHTGGPMVQQGPVVSNGQTGSVTWTLSSTHTGDDYEAYYLPISDTSPEAAWWSETEPEPEPDQEPYEIEYIRGTRADYEAFVAAIRNKQDTIRAP